MENMKLALMKRIRDEVPEIGTIDEDYGQIESSEDQYPVIYPAVLINTDETNWSDSATRPVLQKGTALITVKLVIDCYDDTHIGSSTEEKILERDALNQSILDAVHGFKISKEVSELSRVASREYPIGRGLKVYETRFSYTVWSRF